MKTHETGAVRSDDAKKPRPFEVSPFAMLELAEWCRRGCEQHGRLNYQKGLPLSRYFDGAMRHLLKEQIGMTDEKHAVAAFWNLMGYVHTYVAIDLGLLPPELDDMAHYRVEREVLETYLENLSR